MRQIIKLDHVLLFTNILRTLLMIQTMLGGSLVTIRFSKSILHHGV